MRTRKELKTNQEQGTEEERIAQPDADHESIKKRKITEDDREVAEGWRAETKNQPEIAAKKEIKVQRRKTPARGASSPVGVTKDPA